MNESYQNINFENLIQNLSGLGVFITSLISLFTLLVLIKQRKDSFRPWVIFGHRLNAKCRIEQNNILKTKWEKAYLEKEDDFIEFTFKLFNVGVGIAENVTVKEIFDLKKAKNLILKFDKDKEFNIEENDNILEISTTFDNSFMLLNIEKSTRELGTFINRQQVEPQEYIFTDTCLAFLSCFEYLRNKHKRKMSLDKFPNCIYELRYADVEGKIYKAKYVCKISSIFSDHYTFDFIKK